MIWQPLHTDSQYELSDAIMQTTDKRKQHKRSFLFHSDGINCNISFKHPRFLIHVYSIVW